MKKQNSLFVVFALSLTAVLMFAYSSFVGYFNGQDVHQAQYNQLQKQLEKEKLKTSLLNFQLQDFQQSVAQVLPSQENLQSEYRLDNFSQVVRNPASSNVDLSAALFEKAKDLFAKQKYEESTRILSELVEKYPLSEHVIEAKFFIAEGFFLTKDYRRSMDIIDQMVLQYPEHDLTGFILLRMGQISEINNQAPEALEVYKAVQKNFKNPDLRVQAKRLAQHVEK